MVFPLPNVLLQGSYVLLLSVSKAARQLDVAPHSSVL